MDSEERELEEAQDDQEEVGEAESNPKTSRPSENLRDKAAKTTDKSQDSEEPAWVSLPLNDPLFFRITFTKLQEINKRILDNIHKG